MLSSLRLLLGSLPSRWLAIVVLVKKRFVTSKLPLDAENAVIVESAVRGVGNEQTAY
jgi:hypothetical protein